MDLSPFRVEERSLLYTSKQLNGETLKEFALRLQKISVKIPSICIYFGDRRPIKNRQSSLLAETKLTFQQSLEKAHPISLASNEYGHEHAMDITKELSLGRISVEKSALQTLRIASTLIVRHYLYDVFINEIPLEIEIDTGSPVSIVKLSTFRELRANLEQTINLFTGYDGKLRNLKAVISLKSDVLAWHSRARHISFYKRENVHKILVGWENQGMVENWKNRWKYVPKMVAKMAPSKKNAAEPKAPVRTESLDISLAPCPLPHANKALSEACTPSPKQPTTRVPSAVAKQPTTQAPSTLAKQLTTQAQSALAKKSTTRTTFALANHQLTSKAPSVARTGSLKASKPGSPAAPQQTKKTRRGTKEKGKGICPWIHESTGSNDWTGATAGLPHLIGCYSPRLVATSCAAITKHVALSRAAVAIPNCTPAGSVAIPNCTSLLIGCAFSVVDTFFSADDCTPARRLNKTEVQAISQSQYEDNQRRYGVASYHALRRDAVGYFENLQINFP
ncbi:hypothetical protein RF11_04775 [Thelohanellus kitauei]|uniref:Uncharacterized protein n=1 Tax=Thelohanellus kitauei TaxID=669202 RepID=A0A0C2IAT8_THEKT|nr:hypothetical protein RF11_04775 [Thelohanellus kitauei]